MGTVTTHKWGIVERAPHRRFAIAIVVFVVVSVGIFTVPMVHAPGEVYTLSLSSSRVQESNTPGVTLYVNVTNAVIGQRYQLTFSVNDPTGAGKNSSNSTTTTASSTFILSVVYPRDFGAGLVMKYVGNYTINVAQNQPINKPSVATGQFQVGLTDSKTYQRTYLVLIKATGYATNANITMSLVQSGTPAPGFPKWLLADVSGSLNFSWRIPPSEALGSYTLTLTGSPLKTPQDTQVFTLFPTTVNVPGLTVGTPSISRSLTEQFLFAPQYPDGQRVRTGQAAIRILESDGVSYVNITGNYDGLIGVFRATYYIPRNAMVGIWAATIDTNKFDDGYGNLGPTLPVYIPFYVQPASLNVSVIATAPTGKTYSPGDIIPVYASVNYPDGTAFASGTVTAKFKHSGILVGSPVTLSYIPGQQEWAGNYQVTNNDPSGIWLITVDASDPLADTGQGTSSAAVNVPPTTPQPTGLSTSSFLLFVAIAAAAALAALFWMLLVARRKVTRSVVKLDLRFVDKEVDRIQDSEFFQNVKKQVEDKKPP